MTTMRTRSSANTSRLRTGPIGYKPEPSVTDQDQGRQLQDWNSVWRS